MKAVMVMFDSLNRNYLSPYGCEWTHTPNFQRLANKSVTFDRCYVGSMPCMPARRELHTGRYNFLHNSWGPIEPFDDSMPEILKDNGVYSHLVSDHYHYWEDGGCTYHTRYNSWEISRGQEGDPWKCEVEDPEIPDSLNKRDGLWGRQDWVNRKYMKNEENHSQAVTFQLGMEFIHKNHNEDRWFLQLETFDPHEPYFSYEKYKEQYPHLYDGAHYDWPPYAEVTEATRKYVEHIRYEYAALLSMCDHYLGKVLDLFDRYNLWEDTLLIVNTDHGFLLGEHGWWGKCAMPFFGEISNTPLFIWDPRTKAAGERRNSLVQTIDLAPTILDFFQVQIPKDMEGKPLQGVIKNDLPVREEALFGMFGGHVNITDGRYVYMRGSQSSDNLPLYEYTLMPTRHGAGRAFTDHDMLLDMELHEPFDFTKQLKTMKIKSRGRPGMRFDSMLFDLQNDPDQLRPIKNKEVEDKLIQRIINIMKRNDAPEEQYERLGL